MSIHPKRTCVALAASIRGRRSGVPWSARLLRRAVPRMLTANQELRALFDASWYLARYTDVVAGDLDPLSHYLEDGARLGYDPNPLFDSDWYLARNPDVADEDLNPLLHYVLFGAAEGRDPHPLFDSDWYLASNPDVARRGLNPLAHYLCVGGREGRDPHPLFDASWYSRQCPDARGSALDPLSHYEAHGAAQGYDPCPLFDTDWYWSRYLAHSEERLSPLVHFVVHGASGHLDPHPRFDSRSYVLEHPDCREAGTNPLVHFLLKQRADALEGLPHAGRGSRGSGAGRPSDTLNAFRRAARIGRPWAWRPLLRAAEPLLDLGRRSLSGSRAAVPGTRHSAAGPADPGDRFPFPMPASSRPDVTIVVYTGDAAERAYACLAAIAENTRGMSFELILVDDGSTRDSASVLRVVRDISIIANSTRLGFAAGCNEGVARARSPLVVLMTDAIIVRPGWLAALMAVAETRGRAAMVCPKVLTPAGRLMEAGSVVRDDGRLEGCGFGQDPQRARFNFVREVDCAVTPLFLVKRTLFREAGGFDVSNGWGTGLAFHDPIVGLVRALQARGQKIFYQPRSEVVRTGLIECDSTAGGPSRDPAEAGVNISVASTGAGAEPREVARVCGAVAPDGRGVPRVLVIDHLVPAPDKDAGSLRMFNIIGFLVRLKFAVAFGAYAGDRATGPYEDTLQQMGVEVLIGPQAIREYLEEVGERLNVCILCRPGGAEYLSEVRSRSPLAVVFYDTVDLHFVRERRRAEVERSPAAEASAEHFRVVELDAVRLADATIAVTDVERGIIESEVPSATVHVIPIIHRVSCGTAPFLRREGMVFVGNFGHQPNIDGVLYFVREILPLVRLRLPAVRLHVVGDNAPETVLALAGDAVIIEGWIPDLRLMLEQCRVAVAPLRYGAGLKGKVGESMAAGLPVVCTTIAVEGMPVLDGRDVLIADKPADFATKVADVYECEALWRAISSQGRLTAGASYAPTVVFRSFRRMLANHGALPPRRPAAAGASWAKAPGAAPAASEGR